MIFFVVVVFLFSQNNFIMVNNMNLDFRDLPKGFDGFKIVQISDLHNKMFGSNQRRLVAKIKKAQPDVIFITGDMVDSRKYDAKPALILIDEIIDIAPIYYVTGNHEFRLAEFSFLMKEIEKRGVNVLRNSSEILEIDGDEMRIIGVDDPTTLGDMFDEEKNLAVSIDIAIGENEEGYFDLLLSHRPEYFPIYAESQMDLTFSGHAHGGQFRLPLIGGIIAPNQGLLPKYTAGVYTEGDSKMVVSRGLGNSIIPQRIFNRPELVVVTLYRGN
ncbi:metallophosphoesterase [Alkalicella caledoniensis]|uniref:Metallophosphoesterase n=2 Tax=Alkalicella caledoniensis TaxID=2731377 RepID=A0A7G9WD44_ALKCA|nr:metallophosphoesterase [Alkalicella caledoniensis]